MGLLQGLMHKALLGLLNQCDVEAVSTVTACPVMLSLQERLALQNFSFNQLFSFSASYLSLAVCSVMLTRFDSLQV